MPRLGQTIVIIKFSVGFLGIRLVFFWTIPQQLTSVIHTYWRTSRMNLKRRQLKSSTPDIFSLLPVHVHIYEENGKTHTL